MRRLIALLVLVALFAQGQGIAPHRRLNFRPSAGGGGGYSAVAATFDGTVWMELDSNGGPPTSTDFVVFSGWWNPSGTDSDAMRIFGTDDRIAINRGGGDNSIRVVLKDSGGNAVVSLQQNVGVGAGQVPVVGNASGWTWIFSTVDNTTAGRCYLFLANAATGWVPVDCTIRNNDTGGGMDIDMDDSEWVVGANNGGSSPIFGCLAEIYFDQSSWRDGSDSAVRDLFYNASTHHPSGDLSGIGSPEVYLKGSGMSFTANSGSIGNFNLKGSATLTSCTGP